MRVRFMRPALIALVLAAAPFGLADGSAPRTAPPETRPGLVVVVPVDGEINVGAEDALRRMIAKAREDDARVLMLEINSPGGAVDACQRMCEMLREAATDPTQPLHTVAYVRAQALSAAAVLSLACREIVMQRDARLGAAQVVMVGPGSVETAPEKMQSVFRSLVRALAQANGYPEALCEAMVDPDLGVSRVRYGDGTVKYVPADDPSLAETAKADAADAAPAEKKVIAPKGKLVTLTANEAVEYDIARAAVTDLDAAAALVAGPSSPVRRYAMTALEKATRFLNSVAVTMLLLVVGLVAVYVAIKTPGFGAPEAVALICFGVFFASKHLAGLAGIAEILLFVAGAVLLAIEIFVTPGFGVMGVSGIVCILLSIILAMQRFVFPDPALPIQVDTFVKNLYVLFGSLCLSIVLFALLLRFLPESALFRRVILEQGTVLGDGAGAEGDRAQWVGRRGTALTTLRPSGRAEIAGRTLDVVADGDFIEEGEAVVVREVCGARIVVRRV